MIGRRFGRLTVQKLVNGETYATKRFICVCDCGKSKEASMQSLKKGHTKSCGCLNIQRAIETNTKHGKHKYPEYAVWTSMKSRCYNKKNSSYCYYGGKGIKVCSEWLHSFEVFYQDMGLKPNKNSQIDRIDCDGDYSPANCRWVTPTENNNNRKNYNVNISLNGTTKTIAQWSRELGISSTCIKYRLKKGLPTSIVLSRERINKCLKNITTMTFLAALCAGCTYNLEVVRPPPALLNPEKKLPQSVRLAHDSWLMPQKTMSTIRW